MKSESCCLHAIANPMHILPDHPRLFCRYDMWKELSNSLVVRTRLVPSSGRQDHVVSGVPQNKKSVQMMMETFKRCPKCKSFVDKTTGCKHMTCASCAYCQFVSRVSVVEAHQCCFVSTGHHE